MADAAARLQNYNNDLVPAPEVKCIEELREKREDVLRKIEAEKEEKAKIQQDLKILTDKLSRINESIQRKQQAYEDYQKTITESEKAFNKILESSHTLLSVLRRETMTLNKKKQGSF